MLENPFISAQDGGKKYQTTSSSELVEGFVESTEVWFSTYFYFDCVGILALSVPIKRSKYWSLSL